MIEIGAVSSADSNLTSGGASSVDLSYYPYPGKSGAEGAGEATMSFSDFLDMINPLQHIPVLSAAYRAATGESINPVSRVAGDVLYGAAMGLASAGLTAVGAIGDEVVTAVNGGHSAAETVMASLFGNDANSTASSDTQLAAATDTTTPAANPTKVADTANTANTQTASSFQIAGLQTPSPQRSPILDAPNLNATPQTVAATQVPMQLAMKLPAANGTQTGTAQTAASTAATAQIRNAPSGAAQLAAVQSMLSSGAGPMASAMQTVATARVTAPSASATQTQTASAESGTIPLLQATNNGAVADASTLNKAMPLDRSKQAYGGVMDPAMMQSAQQNQTLALAMAGSAGVIQAQHTIRNNRFATTGTVTPLSSGSATNPMTSAPLAPTAPQTQAALENLIAQIQASKGINQYKNAAQATPAPGSSVNVTN